MLRTVVTQKDIAKRTGFSVNTVSHALRGMSDISEETRKVILETAEEMETRGLVFTHPAAAELDILFSAVREILDLALRAFQKNHPGTYSGSEPDGICGTKTRAALKKAG